MKKIFYLLLVLFLIVAGFFYFYNSGQISGSKTVSSTDGSFSVEVAESALPGHIKPDDIKVERIELADSPIVCGDNVTYAAYSMQPHGVTFLEPIPFEIHVNVPKNTLPAVYHISPYGFEKLDNIVIEYDSTNTKATIRGETDHFSYFYIMAGAFSVELSTPDTAVVGEKFQVSAITKKVRKKELIVIADHIDETGDDPYMKAIFNQWKEAAGITGELQKDFELGELVFIDPWELSGFVDAESGNIIKPKLIKEAPEKTEVTNNPLDLTNTGKYVYNGNFICMNPGLATFVYEANIYIKTKMEWDVNPPFDINFDENPNPITIRKFSKIECLSSSLEENDDDHGDDDQDDEDQSEGQGLEEVEKDCPDCEALQAEIGVAEAKLAELNDQLKDAKERLKDAELTEDLLDNDLDSLINQAGCNSNQDSGAVLGSGQSAGNVTSRNRPFFCPNEATAGALVDGLKEFWKENNSPSGIRNEVKQIEKEITKLELKSKEKKKNMKNCPCDAIHKASELSDLRPELISLTHTIRKGDACIKKFKQLNLRPESDVSDHFKIVGDLPKWLEFSPMEGKLPMDVNVNFNCNEVAKLNVGEHVTDGNLEIFNKEDKKIKGIPLNVIFGIIEDTASSDNTSDTVVIDPPFIDFVYDHANPICPLPLEPITINGPVGGQWQLVTPPPTWLTISKDHGAFPTEIQMNFPCKLDKYENQKQSFTLDFSYQPLQGPGGNAEVIVNGSFTNF